MSMVEQPMGAMPTFTWSSPTAMPSLDDHRAFGRALGTQYGELIRNRFAKKSNLAAMIKVAHSGEGKALYDSFITLHREAYPSAMAEVEGIADGAGVPFEQAFLQNIEEEFSLCSPTLAREDVDACSDVMACNPAAGGLCAVAHNEDNAAEDIGSLLIVDASFGPKRSWTAATYAGELSSGAFGYSRSGGFGFTLNYVGPKQPACPGAGRVFAARTMLDAGSYEAALTTITAQTRMGSGHNYQLFSFAQSQPPRVSNIEVAPRGLYAVRPIGAAARAEPFFHANQYQSLRVPEYLGNSSTHRLARWAQLPPPSDISEMLHVLGDQEDRAWPIFHDNASHARGDLSDWTLCTALFDLRERRLDVYAGNPRMGRVVLRRELG